MKLSEFATEEHPLRSSQIPLLMGCSWRSVLLMIKEFSDEVGAAADSGSAFHKAAETLHRHHKSYDDCIAESKACSDLYPKVDWDEVRLYFQPYYNDPRNQHAEFATFNGKVAIEEHFKIHFPNPEGTEEIVIQGTYDQIRIINNEYGEQKYRLIDLKTGKSMNLYDTLMHHTFQLACYWLGADFNNHKVDEIAIGYIYGYRQRGANLPSPDGIFAPHSLQNVDQCRTIMKGVFRRINAIRRGEIDITPGVNICNKCPARGPDVCLPIYEERISLLIS
jgi:hypothetical protein